MEINFMQSCEQLKNLYYFMKIRVYIKHEFSEKILNRCTQSTIHLTNFVLNTMGSNTFNVNFHEKNEEIYQATGLRLVIMGWDTLNMHFDKRY